MRDNKHERLPSKILAVEMHTALTQGMEMMGDKIKTEDLLDAVGMLTLALFGELVAQEAMSLYGAKKNMKIIAERVIELLPVEVESIKRVLE